jgi:hypothetical protein
LWQKLDPFVGFGGSFDDLIPLVQKVPQICAEYGKFRESAKPSARSSEFHYVAHHRVSVFTIEEMVMLK